MLVCVGVDGLCECVVSMWSSGVGGGVEKL